jgi:hypothetical protein
MIMALMSFDCTHLLLGMVTYIHLLVVFAAIAPLLGDQPITGDVTYNYKLILQGIVEHELPPLAGKQ